MKITIEQAAEHLSKAHKSLRTEIANVIVGQDEVLDQILVSFFACGHCILVGVPGLAKTLMVRTLAQALSLDHKRIQFTPDLMPADITGTEILEDDPVSRKRSFRFQHGPVFTNILLADEINRTPPKTQAALLEAMQERCITSGGVTHKLDEPFLVLATQNPIEQEGTYPLPEAQLDRFMFSINVEYPTEEEESKILLQTTGSDVSEVTPVFNCSEILSFQKLVRKVPVSEHVANYASSLVRASRPGQENTPDFISKWVRWGAGPRAGQYLLLAAKAHVMLEGRFNVSCEDIRKYAASVLRHRVFCSFAAASEGITSDDVIKKLIETVPEPKY
ncbi:MAG: AAA family ATPase [Planctomycetota bacterium]|jgi:MoxR-like ATPase